MQDFNARKAGADDAAKAAHDAEINERLTEHLKANAIRAEQAPGAPQDLKRGFFREVFALIGLVGLMLVAYIYGLLVDKQQTENHS